MSNLKEFIDEHGLTVEEVIDALEIDPSDVANVPDEPTDFYDGSPSASDLADDFDAVDLLIDEKEDLEQQVDSLREQIREAKRPVFEDKAAELAAMTDKWGDTEDLVAKFDAENEDERWTVDDVEDKIELVEDIKGESVTTVDSGGSGAGSRETERQLVADNDGTIDETDIDRTQGGRYDLRSVRGN